MAYNNGASRKLFQLCRTSSEKLHSESEWVTIKIQLRQLIRDGADPNFEFKGSTPLCEACRHGNQVMVRFLLNHGASVDIRDRNGATPLYLATSHGRLDITSLLYNHGADINIQTDNGHSPLSSAMLNSFHDVARFLVENGAQVNIKLSWEVLSWLQHQDTDPNLVYLFLDAGSSPYYSSSFLADDNNTILFHLRRQPDMLNLVHKLVAAGYNISVWVSVVNQMKKELSHLMRLPHYKMLPGLNVDEALDRAIELERYIEITRTEVPPLQQLCRPRIRHELVFSKTAGHIREKVDQLPVPKQMKAYLKLDRLV